MTNNFQRLNEIINYSLKETIEAIQVRQKGDGVYSAEQYEEFARHSGVLEPTLFFADILSIGGGGSEFWNFIVPYRDLVRLRLSRSRFVDKDDAEYTDTYSKLIDKVKTVKKQ